jgi:pimeloyl-ACP methyl ester carboxylesterase
VTTLAADMATPMTGPEHRRFAVVGDDLGTPVAHTPGADGPRRVTHPIATEAMPSGLSPSPPLFTDPEVNDYRWRVVSNRLAEVDDRLVTGREKACLGLQFMPTTAVTPPREVADVHVDHLRDLPARRAGCEYYRTQESMAQLAQRSSITLEMPVPALGGEYSSGEQVGWDLQQVAIDVTGAVLPGTGHFVADESPQAFADLVLDVLQRRP